MEPQLLWKNQIHFAKYNFDSTTKHKFKLFVFFALFVIVLTWFRREYSIKLFLSVFLPRGVLCHSPPPTFGCSGVAF